MPTRYIVSAIGGIAAFRRSPRRWRSAWMILILSLMTCAARAEQLLWFEQGRASGQALEAVDLLSAADAHGLDPASYDAARLQLMVRRAQADEGLPADAAQVLDAALTAAMAAYLTDLRVGRVDPKRAGADFETPLAAGFDAAFHLRSALAAGDLAQAVNDAAPRIPLYTDLLAVLARYRELSGHGAWQHALPPLPAGALKPDQPYEGLVPLAHRLQALGDLQADAFLPARYETILVDAVKRFQARHGLEIDGVVGRATLAALEVTPAQRVRQIELSLERLRWTPLSDTERAIVVNLPEFMLHAYAPQAGRLAPQLTMKVIVGSALDTRTPVFDEDMRFIEFSPYWNIPISIARSETIPRLRRDPGYWDRQGLEFVSRDGSVSRELSEDGLQAVLSGRMRVRQRPGPRNALGDIKFILPNNGNIYLHHTPATQLFQRERRDFSHGCIRVEEPVALALFVLQNEPQWTEQRIRDAMSRGKSRTIRLEQQVPVIMTYSTAVARDGQAYFYADIYGHDKRLDDALRESLRGRSTLQAPGLPQ